MRIRRHHGPGPSAAGCGRARSGRETFPVGPARLVEMNVGVDDAGENREMVRVDFRLRRTGQTLSESGKFSLANPDVLLRASDEQIEIAHEENDEARMTNDE